MIIESKFILFISITFLFSCCIEKENTFEQNTFLNITLLKSKVINKNGIGNEWEFQSRVFEHELFKTQSVRLDISGIQEVFIVSKAIENDKDHDDVGMSRITILPKDLSMFLAPVLITEEVKVKEHYGSGAGNEATCEFIYEVFIDTSNLEKFNN